VVVSIGQLVDWLTDLLTFACCASLPFRYLPAFLPSHL
jgi:hypothetical protein